jgi:uncharacterized protein YoxC
MVQAWPQSEVQKARLDVAKARELTERCREMLRNVEKQVKRAHISQLIVKDEKKRLRGIVSELKREMRCARQASEELAHRPKVEAEALQSKVEALEREVQELKGCLQAGKVLAQQLAERSRKSEVRVRELARQQNATRERLQRGKRLKTKKVNEATYRVVYLNFMMGPCGHHRLFLGHTRGVGEVYYGIQIQRPNCEGDTRTEKAGMDAHH